jgi:hypothetical protein
LLAELGRQLIYITIVYRDQYGNHAELMVALSMTRPRSVRTTLPGKLLITT